MEKQQITFKDLSKDLKFAIVGGYIFSLYVTVMLGILILGILIELFTI